MIGQKKLNKNRTDELFFKKQLDRAVMEKFWSSDKCVQHGTRWNRRKRWGKSSRWTSLASRSFRRSNRWRALRETFQWNRRLNRKRIFFVSEWELIPSSSSISGQVPSSVDTSIRCDWIDFLLLVWLYNISHWFIQINKKRLDLPTSFFPIIWGNERSAAAAVQWDRIDSSSLFGA